jgi:methyl-accepting chemotaxis protein
VTIRAKLYAAIAITILGPVVTIAVALTAFGSLGDRFDEVARRSERQALALELKFAVTDVNGWQTAYGYDGGRSRPQFERSRRKVTRLLADARRELTGPGERALVARIERAYRAFLRLDAVAYRALRAGRPGEVRTLFLGPEIRNFQAMATAAGQLAAGQARSTARARRRFDQERHDARRRLIVVGLGAGVLVILLLITAQDVARLALERREERPA